MRDRFVKMPFRISRQDDFSCNQSQAQMSERNHRKPFPGVVSELCKADKTAETTNIRL